MVKDWWSGQWWSSWARLCAAELCCDRCVTIKADTAARDRDTASSILRSIDTLRTTAIYLKCPLLAALCLTRLCPCPLHWQDQGWRGCNTSCQCRDILDLHSRVKVEASRLTKAGWWSSGVAIDCQFWLSILYWEQCWPVMVCSTQQLTRWRSIRRAQHHCCQRVL